MNEHLPIDPVEIMTGELQSYRPTDFGTDDAVVVLDALRSEGWRIVRTDGDEFPGEDAQITDEWTPEGGADDE